MELVETLPSNIQGDSRILKSSFSGGKGCRNVMLSTHLHLMLTFKTLYTFMERQWNKAKCSKYRWIQHLYAVYRLKDCA